LGKLDGKSILDLGCGEGYCARNYLKLGAAAVHGVDISSEMIQLAQNNGNDARLTFECASIDEFSNDAASHFGKYDVATAVFVSNYLDSAQLRKLVEVAYSSLKPGGEFVLLHPHPHLPYLRQSASSGLQFDVQSESSYFGSIGASHVGHIMDLEGKKIEVRLVHHTLEELFENIITSGFIPRRFRELRLEPDVAKAWPALHATSSETPMHVMIVGQKP
jgi:2-polyprenyl-3-methyl-5-hydroxy-6-metoxy-1,4-benzoquinol methylase